jgi:hypothetical protein
MECTCKAKVSRRGLCAPEYEKSAYVVHCDLCRAAPDLLKALEEMLSWCIWDTDYAARAKSAIAKAKGEAV